MSTIIVHANLHPIGYIYIHIYQDLSNTTCLPKDKIKRERWKSPWLLQNVKVKDRPFAEGSRGCHALLWLYAQNLNAKGHHFILPLVTGTFIVQSVAFISSISQWSYKAYFLHTKRSYIFREQFLLHAPMTTYLKDLTQSIGRYGGLLKIRFGSKDFWMHK